MLQESQKYDPHFDYFFHEQGINNGGNRIMTVLLYLTDVEEGGETVRNDKNIMLIPRGVLCLLSRAMNALRNAPTVQQQQQLALGTR
jgi:hypothetical protein